MEKSVDPYFEEKFALLQNLTLKKKEWLTSGAAFVAGVVVLVIYFQSGPKAPAYAQAEKAFTKWETSPQDETLFLEMKKALKKTPSLNEKYEAPIAQALLNGEKIKEALVLARTPLESLREEAPFHALYAETSLLIEQGIYQEALEKAVSLKERMNQDCNLDRLAAELVGGSLLYAHNLLRIAFLQKELKNKPGEKAAWEEVEAFLGREGPVAEMIFGTFQEKGATLSAYIAERKKQL